MSRIEKIRRYIKNTEYLGDRYSMETLDWIALANEEPALDAVALAFDYGRAKGYRAAKASQKKPTTR